MFNAKNRTSDFFAKLFLQEINKSSLVFANNNCFFLMKYDEKHYALYELNE